MDGSRWNWQGEFFFPFSPCHDCCLWCAEYNVALCVDVSSSSLNPFGFFHHVVVILAVSSSPGLAQRPLHLPSPLSHLGICLLQPSEVSNWLFNYTKHNWVLITVLHSVLIFKSAMSSERGAVRWLVLPAARCCHTSPLISPFTLRPDPDSAGDASSIHHQGLKTKSH